MPILPNPSALESAALMRASRKLSRPSLLILRVAMVTSYGIALFVVRGTVMPLLAAVGVFAAFTVVLRRFFRDVLCVEQPGSIISLSLVERLCDCRELTVEGLVHAAFATDCGAFVASGIGISQRALTEAISVTPDESDLGAFMDRAASASHDVGDPLITPEGVCIAAFDSLEALRMFLNRMDLPPEAIGRIVRWGRQRKIFLHRPRLFSPEWIAHSIGSIGRSWVSGYTHALDTLARDIPDLSPHGEGAVIAHRETMEAALHVLHRTASHNVLLLGRSGTGKRTLVRHVLRELHDQETAAGQDPTRAMQLSTQGLISGTGDPETFFLKALDEARLAGKMILVIPDIVQILTSGRPNLKAILARFLEEPSMHVIAICDTESYHTTIKPDPSFASLFETLAVDDAADDDVLAILVARSFALEARHRSQVTYRSLMAAIELSKRYLSAGGGLPGRAVEVLDDAVAQATNARQPYVTEDHVRAIVSLKAKMNIQTLSAAERDVLLTLEETMGKKIIGQCEAVRVLVSALKRAKLDIHGGKRPIGTFLFLGPTGAGKTQTAKVLAETYFGSSDALIRLDMNEFSTEDSVTGIIGSTGGGAGAQGFLAKRVQDRPFSVVLLDEIEKAHPHVLSLFLQMLDEGFLMDALGARTDFRNTIVIATSNAGALFIREFLEQHGAEHREKLKGDLIDAIIAQRSFTPEFLNRFDAVVLYYPLTEETAQQIGRLLVDEVVEEVARKRGIMIRFQPQILETILRKGFDPAFGAREMRRAITENVENVIADYLLRHAVQRGEEIVIGV